MVRDELIIQEGVHDVASSYELVHGQLRTIGSQGTATWGTRCGQTEFHRAVHGLESDKPRFTLRANLRRS